MKSVKKIGIAALTALGLSLSYLNMETIPIYAGRYFLWPRYYKNTVENELKETGVDTFRVDYEKYCSNDAEEAMNYLKLANLIACRHLSQRFSLCGDYTALTYAAYRKLLEINGKEELLPYIRVAFGFDKTDSTEVGHVWIQIKDEHEKWRDFETTVDFIMWCNEKIDYDYPLTIEDRTYIEPSENYRKITIWSKK